MWGRGCAAENPSYASLGSEAVNHGLGDLLELFHGDEQGICLPLQLHHHRGTHPAGTGTRVGGEGPSRKTGGSLHKSDQINTPVLPEKGHLLGRQASVGGGKGFGALPQGL